jgi:LmbE family N-acetylglucosaminyl deacetylase
MRILGVGAHPDDIECYCAGLLAKGAARGDRVYAAVCTNGDLGSVTIPPAELAAVREQEARAGAALYGAELCWLGEPDGQLWVDAKTRAKMAAVLAWAEPEVVVTHVPEDYHPDHRACSELVRGACAARQNSAGTGGPLLLHMDTEAAVDFVPDLYVDISETIETKVAALACHRSQVEWIAAHDGLDLLGWLRAINRARGEQCGVAYAEGYRLAGAAPPGLLQLLP